MKTDVNGTSQLNTSISIKSTTMFHEKHNRDYPICHLAFRYPFVRNVSISLRMKSKHFQTYHHVPKTSDLKGSAWQTSDHSCIACVRSISEKFDKEEVKMNPGIDEMRRPTAQGQLVTSPSSPRANFGLTSNSPRFS